MVGSNDDKEVFGPLMVFVPVFSSSWSLPVMSVSSLAIEGSIALHGDNVQERWVQERRARRDGPGEMILNSKKDLCVCKRRVLAG